MRNIKKDYRALGAAVTDPGTQVVISSVFLVEGKGFERASQIWQNGYRAGATARGSATSTVGLPLRNLVYWGLMGSSWQRKGRPSSVIGLPSW